MENVVSEVKRHKHIIICGDNINSLSVARSLGQEGILPIVIILDYSKYSLLGVSKFVGQIYRTKTEEESLEILKRFADASCKPFVYTTDDNHESLLDMHYDELKDFFYFFNAGAKGRVTACTNKNICCELAAECGLNVPQKEVINVGQVPISLEYPIFIKTLTPYSNGWKHDVGVFYDESELRQSFADFVSNEPLIAQNFIEKKGELSMQGISIAEGQDLYIPFERMYLRFSKTSFGGYMYYQLFNNNDLFEKIKKLIQSIRYSGCFEIEFLVDSKDTLYFLEVNLRFSASNYGVCYGGVNQPYLWAVSTILGRIPIESISPIKRRYYVMNEFSDIRYAKQVGFIKWLKEFICADCYYVINKNDIRPFFAELKYKLTHKFRKS